MKIKNSKKANGDLKEAGLRAMNVMIFTQPIMMLVMNLTSLAVIYFGGNMVIGGSLEIQDFSALLTYITQILMSLMMVTMLFMISSRALASSRRITEVLEEKIDLDDTDAAYKDKKGGKKARSNLKTSASAIIKTVRTRF